MDYDKKIEGKFYPLTPDTAKKLREANLTAAEWRLWSYLVELDPFGDRYLELPDTLTIMQECDMKKSTFYAAIAKLQALELFDFQFRGILARNLAIPKNRKVVQNFGKDSEKSETIPKNRKVVQNFGKDSEKSENQPPEPLPEKDSSSPQTIQTYTDFIKTLSESEREKFLNFVREQIKNLPKQVNDVEAWLANQNQAGQNRWEVYYNNFLANQPQLKPGSSVPPKSNPSKILELAAQCRQKHTEELEKQRIAAQKALEEKTVETQSSFSSVKEKLAELLDKRKKPSFKKPSESEEFKQWKREIELQEQRRIEELMRKYEGGQ
jgi:hypothetical protein